MSVKARLQAKNLTAQLSLLDQLRYRAGGNPPSTVADAAISNCFPGLEFDFRNIWRRIFDGIELHEATNLVVNADPKRRSSASCRSSFALCEPLPNVRRGV